MFTGGISPAYTFTQQQNASKNFVYTPKERRI